MKIKNIVPPDLLAFAKAGLAPYSSYSYRATENFHQQREKDPFLLQKNIGIGVIISQP